jgi:hypothetical protein
MQKRLNFEMSVTMLQRSLQDRERVEKIQGLLNELLSFLEDELSVVIRLEAAAVRHVAGAVHSIGVIYLPRSKERSPCGTRRNLQACLEAA